MKFTTQVHQCCTCTHPVCFHGVDRDLAVRVLAVPVPVLDTVSIKHNSTEHVSTGKRRHNLIPKCMLPQHQYLR